MPTTLVSTLDAVRDLYERGLYVQAYGASKELGPLREWTGSRERVLAGRLAYNLGSPRLGRVLHLLALRENPRDPEVIYYGAGATLASRGLLSGWEFLERHGELAESDDTTRGDWFALRGAVAAQMRDFDTAHAWLSRAEALTPGEPFVWIEHAWVLKEEDRYEEALETAAHSLELRPWYRPGVEMKAHLLTLMGRDAEALELLEEASGRLESPSVVAHLAHLHCELGHYEESRAAWARYADFAPLLDEKGKRWLAGRRSDAAYLCEDFAEAAQWAEQADETLRKTAERIAESRCGQRVVLPVGFIRQHHLTCAPATLATLSGYWTMPADHLELADKICYDGTPHHSQRAWAEANGFAVREFTINWNNCQALIDSGVPFTLTTVDPGNAHLQAVIGYDTRRDTLIIRDPGSRHYIEALAEKTLERYASTGPRGMALVPVGKTSLLDQIDLTDAVLYDHHHRLQGALEEHDRQTAEEVYRSLAADHPDHVLTLMARLSLSDYDADTTGRLETVEAMLERFPHDANLQMIKLYCLRELSRRDERLDYLKEIFDSPKSDPLLWQQYAQELAEDPREHDRAERLLRRCVRARPHDGHLFYALGNIEWDRRHRDEALQLLRFAACREEHNEHLAQTYFSAARLLERTPEALRFLRSRYERFARKSGLPGQTLFWAYSVLDRMDDAFTALDEALRRRPDDSELALYAADAYARYGSAERGRELLERARGRSREATWLQTAATVEVYRGNLREALDLWKQVVAREPLAIEAHRATAHLMEAVESRASARKHLEEAVHRFPHNYALHQALIEFLEEDEPEAAEPVIRHLIEIHPVNAWARLKLAFNLARMGRLDEAVVESDHAIRLEAHNPFCHYVRGWLSTRSGGIVDAQERYRRAIELSVDCEPAIRSLVHNCHSVGERREALAFLQRELVHQVTMGDGLMAFCEVAADTLPPEELLEWLEATRGARPDLWHAWSAVTHQLLSVGRTREALEVARGATERFSLNSRLWSDLARSHLLERDFEKEREALEHALQIDPNYGPAVRQLACTFEREGDFTSSRQLLEQAVARMPLDPQIHGFLADALWKLGEQEAALEHMKRALVIDPGYRWEWETLLGWAEELNQPDIALEAARDLTERRPGEARSWLVLAQVLRSPDTVDETLAALDRAIELNPRCVDAYDARAELLGQVGRMEEAFAACEPEVFRDKPQIRLRGRAAWLKAVAGDLPGAIDMLAGLVEEDPAFYDGWRLLADWYDHSGDAPGYQRAVSQLVRLAPGDFVARGYLADARRRNNQREGAKEEFRRALDISPGYLFAGTSLFDLQLEDGEIEEARHTVCVLKAHAEHPEIRLLEMRLSVRENDREGILRSLGELCLDENANDRALAVAADVLVGAGFSDELENALLQAMTASNAHRRVGELWVERFAADRGWEATESHLHDWRRHPERWVPAVVSYVGVLAEDGEFWRLEKFIESDRALYTEKREIWASIGYAYLALDKPRKAAAWLSDWKDREDVPVWVLGNLAYALRAIDRAVEAKEVSRRALELPADRTSYQHHLWLAADEALGGDHTRAAHHLSSADPVPESDPYYRFLARTVHAVVSAHEEHDGLLAAGSRLRGARAVCPNWSRNAVLRKIYRGAIRHIAESCPRWYAGLWSFFMRLRASFMELEGSRLL